MSEIRVSLLGLGRAGAFHLESIRALPGVRLGQVYDTDRARADRIASEFGCRSAGDAEEATQAPDVDAVVVATPTQTHFAHVTAALAAGKPVLSEKPLGTDRSQIDQCFSLAGEKGVPLLVAFQRRFDPSFAAVVAGARGGEVGELQFIRSVSRDSPVPSLDYLRSSCGIFHDCVVHDLDLVCQIAQQAPEEVFCFGTNLIPEVRDIGDLDNVVVALRFGSGLLASIDVSRQSDHGYDQRIEVVGTRGMLQTENRPGTLAVLSTREGSKRPPIDHSFPSRYSDAYRLEFACFLDCVRGEREVPITHSEVRLSHLLSEAAERSLRERRPVRISQSPEPFVVQEEQCPVEGWGDAARGGVQWRTLLSADRTPTAAMTVGVVEIAPDPGGAFHLHRHPQPEIYFVLSGEGVVAIDGKQHPVRPGSAVFVPGDLEHGVRNTGAETLRILYGFAVDSFGDVEYRFTDPHEPV